MRIIPVLILCLTSAALAEDFTTVNGKQYKNAAVIRVELDGIVLKMKSGIAKLYFAELPKDIRNDSITARREPPSSQPRSKRSPTNRMPQIPRYNRSTNQNNSRNIRNSPLR